MKHAKLIYEHSMKKEITNKSKKITLSAKENDNMKSRKTGRPNINGEKMDSKLFKIKI